MPTTARVSAEHVEVVQSTDPKPRVSAMHVEVVVRVKKSVFYVGTLAIA
jgi:hypothetical protein